VRHGRFLVRAIGYVENDSAVATAPELSRAADSRIVLDTALGQGLRGLKPGSQILVIFCFHRSSGYSLLQHPQGDRKLPRRGVFALRSPDRPNPIGVSVVELLAVEGNVLHVRGLDTIAGTPVLDIRPVPNSVLEAARLLVKAQARMVARLKSGRTERTQLDHDASRASHVQPERKTPETNSAHHINELDLNAVPPRLRQWW
jgi:tRNA-Thr(GGU) m(6)t(6)A37 methyltransferase TsaA